VTSAVAKSHLEMFYLENVVHNACMKTYYSQRNAGSAKTYEAPHLHNDKYTSQTTATTTFVIIALFQVHPTLAFLLMFLCQMLFKTDSV